MDYHQVPIGRKKSNSKNVSADADMRMTRYRRKVGRSSTGEYQYFGVITEKAPQWDLDGKLI